MGINSCIDLTMAKKQQSAAAKGKDASKNAQSLKKGALPGSKKSGTKAKKKSWTKVKVKDKLNNDVFLDKKRYDKLMNEIPKILSVTRAGLIEKFKVNGSVARALLTDLKTQGLIKAVGQQHAKFSLYKGVQSRTALEKAEDEAKAEASKKSKNK